MGQSHAEIDFVSRGADYSIELDQTVAHLRMDTGQEPIRFRMRLLDANPQAEPIRGDRLRGETNYFIGRDPANWLTDVPLFANASFSEIYSGIDVVYYGTDQQRLEYDFIVRPGGDHRQIQLQFEGATSQRIDSEGNLVFEFASGEMVQPAPVTYQRIDGQEVPVESSFRLTPDGIIQFDVGSYDADHDLVIDPKLIYFSYIPATTAGSAEAIEVGSSGEIFVAGTTDNRVQNIVGTSLESDVDFTGTLGFVRRYDFGDEPGVISAVFGGSGQDRVHDIAIHPENGTIYAVGSTDSESFAGDVELFPRSGRDAFVAQLGPDLSDIQTTVFHGENEDVATAIEIDSDGRIFVGGESDSGDFRIQTDVFQPFDLVGRWEGASQANPVGPDEGRVSMNVNSDHRITSFRVNTAPGSDSTISFEVNADIGDDGSFRIEKRSGLFDLDVNGVIESSRTVSGFFTLQTRDAQTGEVASENLQFFTIFRDSGKDVWLAEVAQESVAEILRSVSLGGTRDDSLSDIEVLPGGLVYLAGGTESSNFPVTDANENTRAGFIDGFLSLLQVDAFASSDGSGLFDSRYVGGGQSDTINDIAIDQGGNVHAVGTTSSDDFFTTDNAPGREVNGSLDGFLSVFGTNLSDVRFSTILSGRFQEEAFAVAVDVNGNSYVAGVTNSTTDSDRLFDTSAQSGSFGDHVFVTSVDTEGGAFLSKAVFGGGNNDQANDLALMGSEQWVVGSTEDRDLATLAFPLDTSIDGLFESSPDGDQNGFLAVLRDDIIVNQIDDRADADPEDGVPDVDLNTPGLQTTLRAAIEFANAMPKGLINDTIRFDIPAELRDPSGLNVIRPLESLPTITDQTTIIGNGVIIDGTQADVDSTGLVIESNDGASDGSRIRDLVVRGFGSNGIVVFASNDITLDGVDVVSSGENGIFVTGASRVDILRSDVASNGAAGVLIEDSQRVVVSQGTISGNQLQGVFLRGANTEEVEIGGVIRNNLQEGIQALGDAGRNVYTALVEGNGSHGLLIDGSSGGNEINAALEGNGGDGLHLIDSNSNQIIFSSINGNSGSGVVIHRGTGNSISSSFIGESFDDRGNGQHGVALHGADETRIVDNSIFANGGNGVLIAEGSTRNVIEANFVGIFDSGFFIGLEDGNGGDGIHITESSENTIARNVIGTNRGDGVEVNSPSSTGNQIEGNFIGGPLDEFDEFPLTGNFGHGVFVNNAPSTTIRGTDPGLESDIHQGVIVSNRGDGIHISGEASIGTTVHQVFVGVGVFEVFAEVDGEFDFVEQEIQLGNGGDGIRIAEGASDSSLEFNRIEANLGNGVTVVGETSQKNFLLSNRISENDGIAIDLGDDGTDSVDPLDLDSGPNQRLNPPELFPHCSDSTIRDVGGFLRSTPNSSFFVEFFSATVDPDDGDIEADESIDLIEVSTDANGLAEFSIGIDVPDIQHVRAIASDSEGNSSELSLVAPIFVNQTGDADDADPNDGSPDTDLDTPGFQITLRSALDFVQTADCLDELTIQFAIPEDDPNFQSDTNTFVISPEAGLPAIETALILDGTTQPNDARVVIRGDQLFFDSPGLTVTTTATVKGLGIEQFAFGGILFDGELASESVPVGDLLFLSDVSIRDNGGWGILASGELRIGIDPDNDQPGGGENVISGNGTDAASLSGGVLSLAGRLVGANLTVTDNAGPGIVARDDIELLFGDEPIEVSRNLGPGIASPSNVAYSLGQRVDQPEHFQIVDNAGAGITTFAAVTLQGAVQIEDNAGWGIIAENDVQLGIRQDDLSLSAEPSFLQGNGHGEDLTVFIGFIDGEPLFESPAAASGEDAAPLRGGVLSVQGNIQAAHLDVSLNEGPGLLTSGDIVLLSEVLPIRVNDNLSDGAMTTAGTIKLIDRGATTQTNDSTHSFSRNGGHGVFVEGIGVDVPDGVERSFSFVSSGPVDISDNAGWGIAAADGIVIGFTEAAIQSTTSRSSINANGRASVVTTYEGGTLSRAPGFMDVEQGIGQSSGFLAGGLLSVSGEIRAAELQASSNGGPGVLAADAISLFSSSSPIDVSDNEADGVYSAAGPVLLVDRQLDSVADALHRFERNGGHGIFAQGALDDENGQGIRIEGAVSASDNGGWGVIAKHSVSIGNLAQDQAVSTSSEVDRNGVSATLTTFEPDTLSFDPTFSFDLRSSLLNDGALNGGILSASGNVSLSGLFARDNGGPGVLADDDVIFTGGSSSELAGNHAVGVRSLSGAVLFSAGLAGRSVTHRVDGNRGNGIRAATTADASDVNHGIGVRSDSQLIVEGNRGSGIRATGAVVIGGDSGISPDQRNGVRRNGSGGVIQELADAELSLFPLFDPATLSEGDRGGIEASRLDASDLEVNFNSGDGIRASLDVVLRRAAVCHNVGNQIVSPTQGLTDVVIGAACDAAFPLPIPIAIEAVAEANEQTGEAARFRLLLSRPAQVATTVQIALSGNATAGEDYVDLAEVPVAIGQSEVPFAVEVIDDDIAEFPETLTAELLGVGSDRFEIDPTRSTASTLIRDDDVSGLALNTSLVSLDESGGEATVLVRLTSQPTGDVQLRVAAADTGEVSVATSDLLFTAENWDQPQPIRLVGVDDTEADGDVESVVQVLVDPSGSAAEYVALPASVIRVTTLDDEVSTPPARLVRTVFFNEDANGEASFSNQGTGQRSIIRRIQIDFEGELIFNVGAILPGTSEAQTFQLANIGAATESVSLVVESTRVADGRTSVVLKPSSHLDEFESLADGQYELTINGAAMGIDLGGGESKTIAFHRLFGDSDGDRDVDGLDYLNFYRAAFGDTLRSLAFDLNRNRSVFDEIDDFFRNYGRIL